MAAAPVRRFLQWWDAQKRRLSYGVSDGKTGVMVHSDGEVTVATHGITATRLTPQTVERWSSAPPVDNKDLLTGISSTLQRYVHFEDVRLYLLLSLWTLGTYVYAMFSHYGYLHLHSEKRRSGKTRALEVTQHMAFEGTPPVNAPTAPVVREMAARGSANFFDTLERWRQKSQEAFAALMDLLDAGFRKGGRVSKMVKQEDGKWREESFPVYAPYGMAGINKDSLTDTALDRAFSIEMARKGRRVRKANYDFDACEKECTPIRDDCYTWALQNAVRLANTYESAALERQMERIALNDRAANIWKPLFAIASLAGLDHETVTGLEQLAQEMGGDPEAAEDARRVQVATYLSEQAGFQPDETLLAMSSELITLLSFGQIDLKPSELPALLTEWGFEQRSVRRDGKEPRYMWCLSASDLNRVADEIRGYVTPLTPENGHYNDYTENAASDDSGSETGAPINIAMRPESAGEDRHV